MRLLKAAALYSGHGVTHGRLYDVITVNLEDNTASIEDDFGAIQEVQLGTDIIIIEHESYEGFREALISYSDVMRQVGGEVLLDMTARELLAYLQEQRVFFTVNRVVPKG